MQLPPTPRRRRAAVPKVALVAVATLAVMFGGVLPASAASGDEADGATAVLADKIAAAALIDSSPTALAAALGMSVGGAGSLQFDDEGRLSVTVRFSAMPTDAQLSALEAQGTVTAQYSFTPAVTAYLDPATLDEVERMTGVTAVVPDLAAQTSGTGLSAHARAADTATALMAAEMGEESCRSLPVQADGPLGSSAARERFGVDGSGVSVGVISDSFATLTTPTSAADDVVAGLLPGPGNPCGWDTPVDVLRDATTSMSDEGRAMAQLIHGVAPASELMFAAAGESPTAMAQAILDLAEAGADIIVDDVIYSTEPYFQADVVAWAIDKVQREYGVLYLTEIFNANVVGAEGGESAGLPIAGWRTAAYRPMECPEWVQTPQGADTVVDCLDFDPGEGEVPFDQWLLGASEYSASAMISWAEPINDVRSRFTVQFYLYEDEAFTFQGETTQTDATRPVAYADYDDDLDINTYFEVVVVRTAVSPTYPTPALWLGWNENDGGNLLARAYDTSAGDDVVGPIAWGHDAAGYGMSIAAVDSTDTSTVETFSSLGPGVRAFEIVDPGSTTPSAPLTEPLPVNVPTIASIDGVVTSVVLGPEVDIDGVTGYTFKGTSAATPNAGAVFALARQYAPGTSWDDLVDIARVTAHPLTNPYSSVGYADQYVFGAGLINAEDLLGALPVGAVENLRLTGVTSTTLTVEWDDMRAAAGYQVEILGGGTTELFTEPAGTTSVTFDDLTPETSYEIRVTAFNDDADLGPRSSVSTETDITPEPVAPPTAPSADDLTDGDRGGLTGPTGSVQPGDDVSVSGLPARSWVYGWFFSSPAATQWVWTGMTGTATFTVPSTLLPGSHRLAVSGADGSLIGWVPITVAGSSSGGGGSLPATGPADMTPVVWSATGAVSLGLIILGVGIGIRRRGAAPHV
ncbi:hypothetical protein GCM10009808_26170 [Microbacterium sediminicola]|uniref:Fibronectin type-III domain-containing protein n=1 Tax=Microbacterium sediminicola TaxID=415210 RepID=A0ABN2IKM3_9MICO